MQTGLQEPAYDGVSCAGRRAMTTENGDVTAQACNGHGTICPSGERLDRTRLDGTPTAIAYTDLCLGEKDGCVCDDGWTGDACTAPVPSDASTSVVFVKGGAYATLRIRSPVSNVYVDVDDSYPEARCTPTSVTVGDTPAVSSIGCVATNDAGRYWCDAVEGSFVTIRTLETYPACTIRVHVGDHYDSCGNFTNPRAARFFANEYYRGWFQYDEIQSEGSVTTACMYDSNHMGNLGLNRVSALRYDDDGTISMRGCGEETDPPRGATSDSGCVCNIVVGFRFMPETGCACADIEGLGVCGGVGVCRVPSIPYGRCRPDIEDEANDPLSVPFSSSSSSSSPTYTFEGTIAIDGRSWYFPPGSTPSFENVQGGVVDVAYLNSRFLTNVTFECGVGPEPVRIDVNVTWYGHEFVCDDSDRAFEDCYVPYTYWTICDPAYSCPTPVFCHGFVPLWNETACIEPTSRVPNVDDADRLLESGRYVNAWIVWGSGFTNQTDSSSSDAACSNPVYRWLDDASHAAGYVPWPRCQGAIVSHSGVKGAAYGLFDDVVPGLNFNDEIWTQAHYDFVGSFQNDQICVYQEDESSYVPSVLDEKTQDAYALSLAFVSDPAATLILSSGVEGTNVTNVSFVGLFGNENLGTPPPDAFTFWWRLGWTTTMPSGSISTTLIPNASVAGIQLVNDDGSVCGTALRAIQAGESVTFTCDTTTITDAERLRRSWIANRTIPDPITTIWYVPLNWSPNDGNGPIEFNVSYVQKTGGTNWADVSATILGSRRFPYNAAYVSSCASKGGVLRSLNWTTDAAYVKDVTHATHLASRRCTHRWECGRFDRGQRSEECVYDTEYLASQWANGDPTFQENPGVGDEGGCSFKTAKELMDPSLMGYACLAGYDATWSSIWDYDATLRANTNLSLFLLSDDDTTWQGIKCTIPSSPSFGRSTTACGGARGRIARDYFETNRTMRTYDADEVKRCSSLVDETGATYVALLEDTLDLHTFVGGTTVVNVIQGRTFVNGMERSVTASGGTRIEYSDGSWFECVPWVLTTGTRYRTMTYVNGEPIALSSRDFWTEVIIK